MGKRAVAMVALMLAACSLGGTDGNANASQDWAFGGHILPSRVLFGSSVLLPDASGGEVTPDKSENESIVDAFFVDPEYGWGT